MVYTQILDEDFFIPEGEVILCEPIEFGTGGNDALVVGISGTAI